MATRKKPAKPKSIRVNLTFTASTLALIDSQAEAAQMTRSGYLAYLARQLHPAT